MRVVLLSAVFFLNFSLIAANMPKEIAFLQNIDDGSRAYDAAKKKLQAEADIAKKRINVQNLDKDTLEFINKIRKIDSYSADFKQSERGDDKSKFKQISGRLKLARPGKFLWSITSPEKEKQSYISNGTKFWHYDVGLEQVVVDNFNMKKLAHSPFSILLDDLYSITTNYSVKKVAENSFELKPKNKVTGDNYITDLKIVFLNNNSAAIKNISFIAAEHKHMLIDLSNSVVNNPMGASTFNFVPPKGVDVINSDEIM